MGWRDCGWLVGQPEVSRFIHHPARWRRFFRCSLAASNFRSLTPAARVALTLAPGAVWFTNPATGARALAPRVSERLDVSQVIGAGPRIGFSIGAEWWGLRGSAPRWIVPLGVTLALR